MNGIDKITQRITEDVDRVIAGIQAQAQEQADAITADYAERARKTAADILARGQVAADEREAGIHRMAQMEAKKALLAVKQEMLDRAFDMALEKLCVLPQEDAVALLARLAAGSARTGREKVILSPAEKDTIGEAVVARANELLAQRGRLTLSGETRPFRGGLILSDGAVEVNCTYDPLLRLERSRAAGEVAGILFQ